MLTHKQGCLRSLRDQAIIKPETVDAIFANVEEILGYSQRIVDLLAPIICDWDEFCCVAKPIMTIVCTFPTARSFSTVTHPSNLTRHSHTSQAPAMLDAYAVYMRNHGKALAVIDETAKRKSAFVFYLQQVKAHPQSGSWDLKMFLITPVQRLLRYSLLFKDYRNHTPAAHEDYIHTLNLLAILEKHATLVNSAISREENRSKLQEIAASFSSLPKPVADLVLSDHVFIRSGPLTKVCRKTNMRRWFWLFSDCLVYGKATGVGGAPQGFVYHRHFALAKVRVKNLPESDGLFFDLFSPHLSSTTFVVDGVVIVKNRTCQCIPSDNHGKVVHGDGRHAPGEGRVAPRLPRRAAPDQAPTVLRRRCAAERAHHRRRAGVS